MERLAILDFCTGNVDIYPVEYENEPDMIELLDSLGHRELLTTICTDESQGDDVSKVCKVAIECADALIEILKK